MGRHRKGRRRLNGMGTLELKKSGIYIARWIVDGHKYSRSTRKTVRSEAEKMLAEFVRPFQQKGEVERLENLVTQIRVKRGEIEAEEDAKPSLKLTDAFDAYFREVNVSKVSAGTERVYLDMFHRLEKFVKGYRRHKVVEMREFTAEMAKAFLTELKDEVRSATYNRYLNFFKLLWRTLRNEARLTSNPWEGFKKQVLDTESRRNLNMDEIKRVISSLDGEWRTLFMLGYFTGLRLVDCAHAKFENVDFDKHVISVVPQKTKRKRRGPIVIPLATDLYNQILKTPIEKRHGYIMPNCAKLYDGNAINYKLKQIFEKNGIATEKDGTKKRKTCVVGFHSLRSGFVTYAINAGIPLPIVQMIVGHGSPRMTEHYYHENKTSLAQCVNAIPSLFDNAKEREVLTLESETLGMIRSCLTANENMDEGLKRILSEFKAKETECAKVSEPIDVESVYRKVS